VILIYIYRTDFETTTVKVQLTNTGIWLCTKASSMVNMARLTRILVVVRVIYNSIYKNRGGEKSEEDKLTDAQKEAAELERIREHGGAEQVQKC